MLRHPWFPLALIGAVLAGFGGRVLAQHDTGEAGSAEVQPASEEGRQAIARFRVPEGLKVELFAAEPMLANPVAFDIDDQGRFYVVETFRLHDGVTDIRGHMNWLDDDLASRTVADRVEVYRKYLSAEEFQAYGVKDDRLRLVEDRDHDGVADVATVFAEGFTDQSVGLGAGVLALGKDVYYTCIPDVWKLTDTDGDGKADEKTSLSTGYGLHVGFLGHDLHGLILGPDGRIYFSIGDRGLNATGIDGTKVASFNSGAVLRCNPDGTGLEVVAIGLRNPQELAFDDRGNLFTVDNNSDSGDQARLVHIVPGGDSGWRIGWQFIEKPNSRGPWNSEKMWHPANRDQPAYLVPPVANISDGPSGLVYNPGTGLGDAQRGKFFLADFRGTAGNSGLRMFSVEPDGASFKLAKEEQYLWGLAATDVDFGPDGALYVSDWVDGWGKTGKGRIYRVDEAKPSEPALKSEVARVLADGMDGLRVDDLAKLLGHADLRVRQKAHLRLASLCESSESGAFRTLIATANGGGPLAAKRHAIWGLGVASRSKDLPVEAALVKLAVDPESDVRVQAIRSLADLVHAGRLAGSAELRTTMVKSLADPDAHVRFQAAMALGELKDREATGPLVDLIRRNGDGDPYLRHAAVVGLAGSAGVNDLVALKADDSASVRLGALLALRRLASPKVAEFLTDADPRVATEAARALDDRDWDGAIRDLANFKADGRTPLPLLRRMINANRRLADAASADRLVGLAADRDLPEACRSEALDALAGWSEEPARDLVTGLYAPYRGADAAKARDALAGKVDELLKADADAVAIAAAQAATALKVREAVPALQAILADRDRPADLRLAALRGLAGLDADGLSDAVALAGADPNEELRAEALTLVRKVSPETAIATLEKVLEGGSVTEKQTAFGVLSDLDDDRADALLATKLEVLLAGKLEREVELDLLEAARGRDAESIKAKLASYEATRDPNDPLSGYREALQGGNFRRGMAIFREKTELSCLRCHKVRGDGGEVGPELTRIGAEKPREYLLESIVAPNAAIAQGFETVVVATTDGRVIAGVLKSEDDQILKLMTPEAELVEIKKDDIEERSRGDSAMPADLITKMSKAELRDLVEFLARMRGGFGG